MRAGGPKGTGWSLDEVEQTSELRTWLRRALFSIIMIVFYTSIVLALTEAGLRVLGFTPRASPRLDPATFMTDAKLGWVNRPGTYPFARGRQGLDDFSR